MQNLVDSDFLNENPHQLWLNLTPSGARYCHFGVKKDQILNSLIWSNLKLFRIGFIIRLRFSTILVLNFVHENVIDDVTSIHLKSTGNLTRLLWNNSPRYLIKICSEPFFLMRRYTSPTNISHCKTNFVNKIHYVA